MVKTKRHTRFVIFVGFSNDRANQYVELDGATTDLGSLAARAEEPLSVKGRTTAVGGSNNLDL